MESGAPITKTIQELKSQLRYASIDHRDPLYRKMLRYFGKQNPDIETGVAYLTAEASKADSLSKLEEIKECRRILPIHLRNEPPESRPLLKEKFRELDAAIKEAERRNANREIAGGDIEGDMPVPLEKARQALLKHTIHAYSYLDHVVASILIEADNPDVPYIMHLTYTGKELKVDRAFLVDLQRKVVVDLTSNWKTDINMKLKIEAISKDLEL